MMALARSQSGPGGLSINTSSANSLFGTGTTPAAGMFGSTPASKPLFGAATTTAAPQSTGLSGSTTGTSGGLFGSTTTSQPQVGGLFGTATTQPQAGGSFGSTPSQQQTGGLFGATTTTSQPQSGGLFGAITTTSQPQTGGTFGSSAQPSGGLFGNTTTSQAAPAGGLFSDARNAQTQNTGGGLFGNSTSQPAQSGSLFGNMNTQNPAKPGTTFFSSLGNNQNQAQPQASGMFNQSQQQPKPQGFGGLASGSVLGGTLGQANNQQQTVPGVRIDTSSMRGTTRFNDLHENLQQQIELCDKLILQEQDYKRQCQAIMPSHGDQLSSVPNDVEFCRRKLIGLDAAMSSDTNAIAKLQELIKKDIEHGQLSGRAIDNLRLPIQYHVSGAWPPKSAPTDARGTEREGLDFVGYFSSTADELFATLEKNKKNIADIELHLRSVEATSGQQVNTLLARKNGQSGSDDDAVRELAAALVEFEQGILNVAGKVGATREGVQTLQLGETFGSTNGNSTNGKRSGIY